MLSWSANETSRDIDLACIADPRVDPGVPGARALAALGRAVVDRDASRSTLDAVAAEIGLPAALDACGVVANFEIMNRVVDAVGLPIGQHARDSQRETIELLGLSTFPHAGR